VTTHYVEDLEQARLLSDPFKLKLLEQFAIEPKTTKQVADALGEKAPKLYRHVDALAQAGLITLVAEKPKRGTVERYFKTVATRFEMAPHLISDGGDQADQAEEMMQSMVRDATNDLATIIRSYSEPPEPEHAPLMMKVSVAASRAQIEELRRLLMAWVDKCESLADAECEGKGLVEARGLVMFYES
jgi:DNA-binding transcriptional ArsR family regulator